MQCEKPNQEYDYDDFFECDCEFSSHDENGLWICLYKKEE
jgi:hypothetical protein